MIGVNFVNLCHIFTMSRSPYRESLLKVKIELEVTPNEGIRQGCGNAGPWIVSVSVAFILNQSHVRLCLIVHLVAASTVNYRYRLFFQVRNFELSCREACYTGCRKYRLSLREIVHFRAPPKMFTGHALFDLSGDLNLTPVLLAGSTEILLEKLARLVKLHLFVQCL